MLAALIFVVFGTYVLHLGFLSSDAAYYLGWMAARVGEHIGAVVGAFLVYAASNGDETPKAVHAHRVLAYLLSFAILIVSLRLDWAADPREVAQHLPGWWGWYFWPALVIGFFGSGLVVAKLVEWLRHR